MSGPAISRNVVSPSLVVSTATQSVSDRRRWRGRGVTVSVSDREAVRPVRMGGANHLLWLASLRSGSRSCLILRPAGAGSSGSASAPPPSGTTLVELEPWLVEEVAGAASSLPAMDDWKDRKAAAYVASMRDAVMTCRDPDPVLAALARAVCRSLPGTRRAEPPRPGDAWMHPAALRRVVEVVEERLQDALRVEALAAVSGLGPSAFLRAFRGTLGETPGEYVTERRVARAEAMLKSTDLPVAWIGAVCGFGTPAHFSTTFRSRRGVQPATLRQAVRRATPAPSNARAGFPLAATRNRQECCR